MNLAEQLLDYQYNDYDNLVEVLSLDGFDLAYGTTYSIQEIHKAVTDNQPSFIRLDNNGQKEMVYVVGANDHSLIAYKNKAYFEMSIANLMKAWTGNAIIITGVSKKILKAYEESESPESQQVESLDYVIFPIERDTWDDTYADIQENSRRLIRKINQVNPHALPTHPVIVLYKKPSEEFRKKGIRAANNGVEIQIYDPSDPYTEFLHELGHIYWNTRLTDEEKNTFNSYQKNMGKDRPPIFLANWDSASGEEVFCTVYYWYMRGLTCHEGYLKILEQLYAEGLNSLQQIIKRLDDAFIEASLQKAKENQVSQTWNQAEKDIAKWINQIQEKPLHLLVKGRDHLNMVKSSLPYEITLNPLEFPFSTKEYTIIHKAGNKMWLRVDSGILKNKYIVLKSGKIDISFMANNKNYYKIPVSKNSKIGGHIYKKKTYMEPEQFIKAKMVEDVSESMVSKDRFSGILTYSMFRKLANKLKGKK